MAATDVQDVANQKLEVLLKAVVKSLVAALEALAGKSIKAKGCMVESASGNSLIQDFDEEQTVVVGELDHDYVGQTLRFVLPSREATTLAGFMMMTPDDVITSNRKQESLTGEDLETFGEVANIFCSGIDAMLREELTDDIVLRSKVHGVVTRSSDPDQLIGTGDFIAYPFTFEIEGYEESQAMILLEKETGTRWNGAEPRLGSPGTGLLPPTDESDPEAAPVRGRLAAYLTDPDILPDVRGACRRVGLALERHIRTDIPNPAAHVGEIVLLDIPSGDSRRFDWCKRLKAFHSDIQVVILIHHPSRSRVIQGFMAQADIILGYPTSSDELTDKLSGLMPEPAPNAE